MIPKFERWVSKPCFFKTVVVNILWLSAQSSYMVFKRSRYCNVFSNKSWMVNMFGHLFVYDFSCLLRHRHGMLYDVKKILGVPKIFFLLQALSRT